MKKCERCGAPWPHLNGGRCDVCHLLRLEDSHAGRRDRKREASERYRLKKAAREQIERAVRLGL